MAALLLSGCLAQVFAQNGNVEADRYEDLLAKAKKVTTAELYNAYGANKDKFGRDRTGQTFIVSGRINEVRKGNVTSNYIVALEVPGASDVVKVVYPENISPVEREYVSLLEKGQGFEAFVVGRSHFEFVDAACTMFNDQLRTVRFATFKMAGNDEGDEGFSDGEF
jgi:hypothetical protein